jgi:hypothetical protein
MKKYLILAILLLASPAWAGTTVINVGRGVTTAAPGNSPEWFGPTAEDRAAGTGGNTYIDLSDTCPFTGSITSVKIFANNSVSDVEFACFEDEGSNNYQTDGSGKSTQSSGTVSLVAGLNTFTGGGEDFTTFDCNEGEYAGVYIPAAGPGQVEYDSTGGTGLMYYSGDAVPTNTTTFTSEGTTTWIISLEFYVEE